MNLVLQTTVLKSTGPVTYNENPGHSASKVERRTFNAYLSFHICDLTKLCAHLL